MVASNHQMKKYSHIQIQICSVHLLGERSEIIPLRPTLIQFLPSSGKNYLKWVIVVNSDRYLKTYLHNPIQTLCAHLLFECSESIRFGPCWPNFDPPEATKWLKMVVPDHCLKNSHAIQFKLGVYTYWVSVQNWIAFGPCWPNYDPLVATEWLNWWLLTVVWKSIHAIQFKLCVYTYWVSVQNWSTFGQRWPNLGSLVATKWMKMMVSDHYLKKHSRKPIQTWCVH